MSETFHDLFRSLVAAGETELAAKLAAMPQGAPQTLVLSAFAGEVERHGPAAAASIARRIEALIDGDGAALSDFSDLRAASDLLAAMQLAESSERSAAKDMVARISGTLGPIVAAVLRALIP